MPTPPGVRSIARFSINYPRLVNGFRDLHANCVLASIAGSSVAIVGAIDSIRGQEKLESPQTKEDAHSCL